MFTHSYYAPTELGELLKARFYKHHAPNGAQT